jgi:hypothetical protein
MWCTLCIRERERDTGDARLPPLTLCIMWYIDIQCTGYNMMYAIYQGARERERQVIRPFRLFRCVSIYQRERERDTGDTRLPPLPPLRQDGPAQAHRHRRRPQHRPHHAGLGIYLYIYLSIYLSIYIYMYVCMYVYSFIDHSCMPPPPYRSPILY